uniref:Uncharacterized protein n=1 Tax=Poecilia reticulata TaxID=8081 RepID=A0A3P9QEQ2_POERE
MGSLTTRGVVIMSPALLAWLGFTTTGIAAGSFAAYLMSMFGTTWWIAWLQSAGAAGFGWLGTSFSAAVGGTMGKIISTVCNVTVKNEP